MMCGGMSTAALGITFTKRDSIKDVLQEQI
jgi:hypothetical protein